MVSHGTCMVEPAKVIVAIDFGTTFSGFSYAHVHSVINNPQKLIDNVEGFEQWPDQAKVGAKPSCKTQTSLLYVQQGYSSSVKYKLKAWGWSACHEHSKMLQESRNGNPESKNFHFIQNFKLALAGSNPYGGSSIPYKLPEGFTVLQVVTDYLHQFSIFIERELQNKYGEHISKKDIQWCLTVPAIWDDSAKKQMKKCAEMAGLVSGPSNVHGESSSHPIIIVLEPEAASVYSLHYLSKTRAINLPAGSKILVVDAGGGTVNLVFQETVNSENNSYHLVKEIGTDGSSGALCGATFVDEAFFQLLSKRISCYKNFIAEHPSAISKIRRNWEDFKFCFDGSPGRYTFWLPAQLGHYWEAHNQERGIYLPGFTYDDLELTSDEMTAVFDSAVDIILNLIDKQVTQVQFKCVDALMVVGGFSCSPYLMRQIRKQFAGRVKHIINPSNSGKAVVTGAVVYACMGNVVVSRISRKTYGSDVSRPFRWGIDPVSLLVHDDYNAEFCTRFDVFVRKGDEVPVNSCIKRRYVPLNRSSGRLFGKMYSTTESSDPTYVTDPGVVEGYEYSFQVPSKARMDVDPEVEVSMNFGHTSIEITAVPLNFKGRMLLLPSITFTAD